MTNLIKQLENEQIAKLGKNIPDFKAGDTVKVLCKIVEDKGRERLQAYEGVCIARSNDGLNSTVTIRKISFGEGVERIFPIYSPNVASIEVVRKGKVRRSKLYYLRNLFGKAARITEDKDRMPEE
ncbi:MAG: 50S ribosomal protein L19 [Alphaproteobacteria bacterium]